MLTFQFEYQRLLTVKLNIRITGASGYLGSILTTELMKSGHKVSGIKRNLLYGPVEDLINEIRNTDVIINLAGAPILQLWTKKRKRIIFESRVLTTKNLVSAIHMLPLKEQPKKFISASAIGIYKSGEFHDEESTNFDEGFAGNVLKKWEEATNALPESIQKNILRIGLTLDKRSLIIRLTRIPFKLGLGAAIGKGDQPFPFVHTNDVIKAFQWIVNDFHESGIFNVTAPHNISNREFSKAYAKVLNRPMFLIIPKFVFKLVLGEASIMITESPQVLPKKLIENGFEFDYPTIEEALLTGMA